MSSALPQTTPFPVNENYQPARVDSPRHAERAREPRADTDRFDELMDETREADRKANDKPDHPVMRPMTTNKDESTIADILVASASANSTTGRASGTTPSELSSKSADNAPGIDPDPLNGFDTATLSSQDSDLAAAPALVAPVVTDPTLNTLTKGSGATVSVPRDVNGNTIKPGTAPSGGSANPPSPGVDPTVGRQSAPALPANQSPGSNHPVAGNESDPKQDLAGAKTDAAKPGLHAFAQQAAQRQGLAPVPTPQMAPPPTPLKSFEAPSAILATPGQTGLAGSNAGASAASAQSAASSSAKPSADGKISGKSGATSAASPTAANSAAATTGNTNTQSLDFFSNGSRSQTPITPMQTMSSPAPLMGDAASTMSGATLSDSGSTGLGDLTTGKASTPAGADRSGQPMPRFTPQSAVRLAAQISQRFNNGSRVFEIRLDPAELGKVDVRLELLPNKQVQARMSVERPETLNELQRATRDLERALNEAGLELAEDGLEFQLQDGNGQSEFGEDSPPNSTNIFLESETIETLNAPIDENAPRSSYGFLLSRRDTIDVRI
jgi:flagellar hook-length control protein FliK